MHNLNVAFAIAAAALFGASTPLAHLLIGAIDAGVLAGVLYVGSGIGLAIVHLALSRGTVKNGEAPIRRRDIPWLAAVILFGGVLGPLFLMLGLSGTDAATASLLLNVEGLATMAIAWLVFREASNARLILGAMAILAGATVLSWQGVGTISVSASFIIAACVCWGIDNNLTRKLSAADPIQLAMLKGLVAGPFNLALAFWQGATLPPFPTLAVAALVGFFGYGLSLTFFILALRHLGTARTGAYFSLAPFVGAAIAISFGAPITPALAIASCLMAVGFWLHLSERHDHEHEHTVGVHEHRHSHDEHHQHRHAPGDPVEEPHSHPHSHGPLHHRHPHYPDLHHQHRH